MGVETGSRERGRPPGRQSAGASWWRALAWGALALTVVALAALLLIAPGRVGTAGGSPGPSGSLSATTRSALATLLGDDEVLRSERGQLRQALERHRDALPPGTADTLIGGLASLDRALEDLTEAWRKEPTNVEVMAQLARVWQQRAQLIERADALVRRASGVEQAG